jgi:drug/metabolite transporter (DMT)-like permease
MNWILAIVSTIVSYTLFSYYGLRTGEVASFKYALIAPVSNLLNFVLAITGSASFGIATYYALKSSPYAITLVICLGILVSFVFSSLFLEGRITTLRILGLGIIILGAWLVK